MSPHQSLSPLLYWTSAGTHSQLNLSSSVLQEHTVLSEGALSWGRELSAAVSWVTGKAVRNMITYYAGTHIASYLSQMSQSRLSLGSNIKMLNASKGQSNVLLGVS